MSAEPDERVCPSCGAVVQRDMRRCYHCGERLNWLGWPEEKEERSRQARRRDSMPHRGGLVMTLGILGLVSLPVCGLVGLVLSLSAWLLGRADLARMSQGTMDREGETNCRIGMICGMIGTPLNVLVFLSCVAWWGFLIPQATEDDQPERGPRFGGPPPHAPEPKDKW